MTAREAIDKLDALRIELEARIAERGSAARLEADLATELYRIVTWWHLAPTATMNDGAR